jgi:tungstate transport system substrate-binding protein
MRQGRLAAAAILAAACLGSCAREPARRVVRLATTTSVENSGLLAAILPAFEHQHGFRVHVIAVGSGNAMRRSASGDADLVLVHSPADEERFVAEGHGVGRRLVMRNAFVLVGPPDDPAGCRDRRAFEALGAIARSGAPFVSRGDDSGTHRKEQVLWHRARASVSPPARIDAGRDMAGTLLLADERRAYTLSDAATFRALESKLDLVGLVEDDPDLDNPYSVIRTNPDRHAGLEADGAVALANWLCGREGQASIAAFRRGGRPVFFPVSPPD